MAIFRGISRSNHGIQLAKRSLKSVLRPLRYRWTTEASLHALFRSLDLQDGQCVFFHSALSRLGFVPKGAETVVNAIRSLANEKRTVAVPTHTWQWVEERGIRDFDVRMTPSCVGAVTEQFRTSKGVIRSLHPTHSIAAFGIGAERLTDGHQTSDTPCGRKTPYHRLLAEDAKIVFLGVGLESNTCFHTIEAEAQVPYLLNDSVDEFVVTDKNGHREKVQIKRHRPYVARRFEQLRHTLSINGILRELSVCSIPCLVLDGSSFYAFMIEQLSIDPLLLLTISERRKWE